VFFAFFTLLSFVIGATEKLDTTLETATTDTKKAALPNVSNASGTLITSDKLEISLNENQSEFLFTGNVKLAAPLFSMECAEAKIITFGKIMNSAPDFDSIKQISITGPLLFRQDERSCSADRAEITTTDTTIILSGNATAKDSRGTISGSEIRINYMAKNIEISSAINNSPVTLNVSTPPPTIENI
jgi:lipopolysaccharide export system protein LptA